MSRLVARHPWRSTLIAVLGVLLVLGTFLYPAVAVQYRGIRERQRLEATLAALKTRTKRLQENVDRLQTPDGVEDVARERLGYVKQGEHPVRVVGEDVSRAAPAADDQPGFGAEAEGALVLPKTGILTRVLDFVFQAR